MDIQLRLTLWLLVLDLFVQTLLLISHRLLVKRVRLIVRRDIILCYWERIEMPVHSSQTSIDFMITDCINRSLIPLKVKINNQLGTIM